MKNIFTSPRSFATFIPAFVLAAALAANATPSFAGPGGGHTHAAPALVDAAKAKKVASRKLASLVQKNRIESTWWGISPNEPTRENYGKGPEWRVTFTNPKASDPTKSMLYVFVNAKGKVVGSNFTGK